MANVKDFIIVQTFLVENQFYLSCFSIFWLHKNGIDGVTFDKMFLILIYL